MEECIGSVSTINISPPKRDPGITEKYSILVMSQSPSQKYSICKGKVGFDADTSCKNLTLPPGQDISNGRTEEGRKMRERDILLRGSSHQRREIPGSAQLRQEVPRLSRTLQGTGEDQKVGARLSQLIYS